MNTDYFKKRGYDVRNNKSLQRYYTSKIPVEVVDDIEKEIFYENRNKLINRAKSYGVTLKEYQLNALIDIAYQYGINGGGINNVLSNLSKGRTVTKNTARGFYEYKDRGNRRWTLFTSGKYLDADGKEL